MKTFSFNQVSKQLASFEVRNNILVFHIAIISNIVASIHWLAAIIMQHTPTSNSKVWKSTIKCSPFPTSNTALLRTGTHFNKALKFVIKKHLLPTFIFKKILRSKISHIFSSYHVVHNQWFPSYGVQVSVHNVKHEDFSVYVWGHFTMMHPLLRIEYAVIMAMAPPCNVYFCVCFCHTGLWCSYISSITAEATHILRASEFVEKGYKLHR